MASLGSPRWGCSYHGFALNVNMDLEPFTRINPCGYTGLQMTSVHHETTASPTMKTLQEQIRNSLEKTF